MDRDWMETYHGKLIDPIKEYKDNNLFKKIVNHNPSNIKYVFYLNSKSNYMNNKSICIYFILYTNGRCKMSQLYNKSDIIETVGALRQIDDPHNSDFVFSWETNVMETRRLYIFLI